MNFERINIFILFVICAASALSVLPTIHNNIDEPNLIVYFNGDEGYAMDLIWFYYSGEKRDSYQMDVDYGIEMLYLSDLARLVLSKFIDFTPGTFVLILRWLHLAFWLCALIAVWFLVGYHFGKGWQQILVTLLLAVRPAFNYFSNSLKPEPLVLLVMIFGFHFIFKTLEKPSTKYISISILSASVAFLIKFAGVFLIPAIIAAIYLGQQRQMAFNRRFLHIFPKTQYSWILELLIGISLIALPFLFIFFYVRKSTGSTFYEEFGLLGSFLKYKATFLIFCIGAVFIFISMLIFALSSTRNSSLKRIMEKINEVNSYALIVVGLFSAFTLFLGFRWMFQWENFRMTYSYNLLDFMGILNMENVPQGVMLKTYLNIVASKILSFDIIMLFLLGFYVAVEFYFGKKNLDYDRLRLRKRLALVVMLIPVFMSIFTFGRFTQHHMLPFFVAVSILGIQGIEIFNNNFNGKRLIKTMAFGFVSALLVIDIVLNGADLMRSRIYQFNQRNDIAFEVSKWLRENISADTLILAEHHTNVYIPVEYKNVKTFGYHRPDRIKQMRQLLEFYRPRYIYYNERAAEKALSLSIGEMLPNKKVRLVESFESSGRRYQRKRGDKFVIYEVSY